MGQKVNPIGLRLGINRTWDSRWYAGKGGYGMLLHEDMKIRDELMKQLKQAAVSKIVIERPHKKARVTRASASTARAGSAAPRSPGWNGTARAGCRCTRCAPTSITASPPRSPPMAPAGSRCGSSRARSWSTTRWRRTSGSPKAKRVAPGAMRRERPIDYERNEDHAATGPDQIPQGAQGTHPRQGVLCDRAQFRAIRAQGRRARSRHRAANRGGAAGDDAAHE